MADENLELVESKVKMLDVVIINYLVIVDRVGF